ncbi:MAG TPA: cytochrome C [Deltaproteobacteria bacterium]|nr:cytochrome C [Deltaproteobacteria bacterium]
MFKKTLFTIAAAAALAGCVARPTPLPEPSSSDAALYRSKCGSCHAIAHPKRHTAAQWEHMLEVMERQMKHRRMEPLTEEERSAILEYLKRNSK